MSAPLLAIVGSALCGALGAAAAIHWFHLETSTIIFSLRPGPRNRLTISIGPGRTGRVDFATPTETFQRDLDIEPGLPETINCSFGAVRIRVVLTPPEVDKDKDKDKDDERVRVEAWAWTGPAFDDGRGGHRWNNVRLLPDREQRMELQWV